MNNKMWLLWGLAIAIFLVGCENSAEDLTSEVTIPAPKTSLDDMSEKSHLSTYNEPGVVYVREMTDLELMIPDDIISIDEVISTLSTGVELFFSQNINGHFISLEYVEPAMTHYNVWRGQVSESEESWENGVFLYEFKLNSANGRWLDLARQNHLFVNDSEAMALPHEDDLVLYKRKVKDYVRTFVPFSIPGRPTASPVYSSPSEDAFFIDLLEFDNTALRFNLGLDEGWQIEVVIERESQEIISFHSFFRKTRGSGIG